MMILQTKINQDGTLNFPRPNIAMGKKSDYFYH